MNIETNKTTEGIVMKEQTLAIIVGNKDFFPDHFVTTARNEITSLLEARSVKYVLLDDKSTYLGAVESFKDAKICADLFKRHRDQIDGILVVLPNFSDEKGIAETIKLSGLNVPILVQAYPDDLNDMRPENRRDVFCGKMSVCNNLYQFGFPFTLTKLHTVNPNTDSFKQDLDKFLAVCRVVNGLRNARFGAIGMRPFAFNTVRYSEKLMQDFGISVIPTEVGDVIAAAKKRDDGEDDVQEKLKKIKGYVNTDGVPEESLLKMAKLGTVIDDFIEQNELDGTGIQCWVALQQRLGVNACTLMSMMGEEGKPSACEVDIMGTIAMYAMQLASGVPSACVDTNNNYGDDPDRCVLFHCGNWPKCYGPAKMNYAPILASTLGQENVYGSLDMHVPAGPLTLCRISTDDINGLIRAYVAEGDFTDDPLDTFGCHAVSHVPRLQELMHFICKNGFEHHVLMNASHIGDVLVEAFETYFGWDVYRHS